MSKITCVSSDDWEGIYVDGELIREGHSVTGAGIQDICIALDVEYEYLWVESEDNFREFGNRFPKDLEEIRAYEG